MARDHDIKRIPRRKLPAKTMLPTREERVQQLVAYALQDVATRLRHREQNHPRRKKPFALDD